MPGAGGGGGARGQSTVNVTCSGNQVVVKQVGEIKIYFTFFSIFVMFILPCYTAGFEAYSNGGNHPIILSCHGKSFHG